MNEKAYKTMTFTGAVNIAVGIVVLIIGIAAGTVSVVCGAQLLKSRKGLIF